MNIIPCRVINMTVEFFNLTIMINYLILSLNSFFQIGLLVNVVLQYPITGYPQAKKLYLYT